MNCLECTKKEKTITGLRDAIARWRARAERTEPRAPGIVRVSYDSRGILTVVVETEYPSSMPYREVWEHVCLRWGRITILRIETRRGAWLAHVSSDAPLAEQRPRDEA
jgi:hypothetical protein